jgi:hypothetical protein
MNKERYEVYVSMNTLRAGTTHRRKEDIAEIRHIYLDFDNNGTEAVRAMRARADIPTPNHVIESSPGRYQTIWRVNGFELDQAEQLMRGMVRELGADPAAVDASRVMRMPAFFNHKRQSPAFVRLETLTDEIYQPAHFPVFTVAQLRGQSQVPAVGAQIRASTGVLTQSERDWAQTKRALALGADPDQLIRELAVQRSDKPNPNYYAELTVSKAQRTLEEDRQRRTSGAQGKNVTRQGGLGMGV